MHTLCTVPGCSNKVHGLGLCTKHYYHIKKHGKILEFSRSEPNRIQIFEDHAKIELRDRKYNIVGYALIDLDDLDKCRKYKWCVNAAGYVVARIDGKLQYMQRFVLNHAGKHTDHVHRNKLDNRKNELRGCTPQENIFNAKLSSNNTTGCKGVYKDKRKRASPWIARIVIKGMKVISEVFATKEAAILRRKQLEKMYYGTIGEQDNTRTPKRRVL